MKKARYRYPQIMGVLKQAESGVSVSELCREYGMSNASFYKWHRSLAVFAVRQVMR